MLSRALRQPPQHHRRRLDQSGRPGRLLHRSLRRSDGREMAHNARNSVGELEEQVGLALAKGPDTRPENCVADLALEEEICRCGRAGAGLCAGFGYGFDKGWLAVERGKV